MMTNKNLLLEALEKEILKAKDNMKAWSDDDLIWWNYWHGRLLCLHETIRLIKQILD